MRCMLLVAGAALMGLAGCVQPPPAAADSCAIADGALSDAAFVIAIDPVAGGRVASGFGVAGCSRTFESTVVYRLLARDGSVLAEGTTQGGGVDGPR